MHLGSGIALIGVATVLVDFIMAVSVGEDFTRLKYRECDEEELRRVSSVDEREPLLAPVSIE